MAARLTTATTHPRPDARARRTFGRGPLTAAALIAAALLPACKATVREQGTASRIPASYRSTSLSADVPAACRVPAVIAAAESTLRDSGYAVNDSRSTEESGFVSARPPNPGWMESTVVTARVSSAGTHITIEIGPWGDEVISRAILDGMLSRLGL